MKQIQNIINKISVFEHNYHCHSELKTQQNNILSKHIYSFSLSTLSGLQLFGWYLS